VPLAASHHPLPITHHPTPTPCHPRKESHVRNTYRSPERTFAKLGRKGRLTEQDVDDAMREVRRALLEADVKTRFLQW
jgi:hypothetical protein